MLYRPEDGWATVEIGGQQLDVSCIEPVPEKLLTALIRALSTGGVAEVTFDAEGWKWRMEAGAETRLTIWGRMQETHTVPVSVQELAALAVADIRRDMDAWSRWNRSESEEMQRATLTRLCDRLEALLAQTYG